MMENKRIWIKLSVVLILLIFIVGVSYAVWRLYLKQNNASQLATTCFRVTLTDKDNINLEKTYPITDNEGKNLTPYTFTITNECEGNVVYQINIEILDTSTLTNMQYIKIMLDDEAPSLISSNPSTTPILSNTSQAYKLKTDAMGAKESKTHELRIWLDRDTPAVEEVMEKIVEMKITVNASYSTFMPQESGAAETIASLVGKRDDLVYDDFGNIRYIGANPSNYVSVDGELWRIIGVLNNVKSNAEDSYGETRVKLIRNDGIGNYSWDTSTYNSGGGINEWSQADLMYLLNPGYTGINGSLYYNSQTGTCYAGENNATTSCDFTNIGLKTGLKNLIDTAVWNTGSNGLEELGTTQKFYEHERSNNIGKICTTGTYCNDPLGRTTAWIGLVGLIYPSDYGYATGGGNYKREYCLSLKLSSNVAECYNDNYLYASGYQQWTITPYAVSPYAIEIFNVLKSGNIANGVAAYTYYVRPSVYLKSDVRILNGDGSENNPFVLG